MIERSPTNVSKEEKDQAFHHRFRSLHFRSRAFLVTHPPFLSFIPGERNGEYRVFLPAWPARKMKIKQRGGMEKRRNERSRLRGKIESTSHPFFFFFFLRRPSNRALIFLVGFTVLGVRINCE